MAKKNGYGKRPMWQWVLVYLIIGGLLYWAAYAMYMKKDGKSSGGLYNSQSDDSASLYEYAE